MNRRSGWIEKYNMAKIYYEHHGHLEINSTFKTKNGYEYDKDGMPLGLFIRNSRTEYNKGRLSDEEIEMLSKIGMRFVCKDIEQAWVNMYNLAKVYFEKNNHLNIPQSFKTKNGYEYDPTGVSLGAWITAQRVRYKKGKLQDDRIELLKQIGMRLDSVFLDMSGEVHCNLAKAYYEYYGDLEVPSSFVTSNGYEYDENGVNLGYWVRNQRSIYLNNKMSEDRYNFLKSIGMRFTNNKKELEWDMKYKIAKVYYKHYGTLEMDKDFKTKDGIKYDPNGVDLARWLSNQKSLNNCNKLSEEKRDLLEAIGMDFSLRDYYKDWLNIYELATNYFNFYGNLEVLREFRTNNGIDYDENGVRLGKWINTQRCQYAKDNMSKDKIDMLDTIGMVWNMQKKKDLIESWCNENNVDYACNRWVLEYISYQELVAKTGYLLSLDESIVDTNGKLHKIFSMSNINIQAVYAISLEELIREYYVIDKDKRLKKENK